MPTVQRSVVRSLQVYRPALVLYSIQKLERVHSATQGVTRVQARGRIPGGCEVSWRSRVLRPAASWRPARVAKSPGWRSKFSKSPAHALSEEAHKPYAPTGYGSRPATIPRKRSSSRSNWERVMVARGASDVSFACVCNFPTKPSISARVRSAVTLALAGALRSRLSLTRSFRIGFALGSEVSPKSA